MSKEMSRKQSASPNLLRPPSPRIPGQNDPRNRASPKTSPGSTLTASKTRRSPSTYDQGSPLIWDRMLQPGVVSTSSSGCASPQLLQMNSAVGIGPGTAASFPAAGMTSLGAAASQNNSSSFPPGPNQINIGGVPSLIYASFPSGSASNARSARNVYKVNALDDSDLLSISQTANFEDENDSEVQSITERLIMDSALQSSLHSLIKQQQLQSQSTSQTQIVHTTTGSTTHTTTNTTQINIHQNQSIPAPQRGAHTTQTAHTQHAQTQSQLSPPHHGAIHYQQGGGGGGEQQVTNMNISVDLAASTGGGGVQFDLEGDERSDGNSTATETYMLDGASDAESAAAASKTLTSLIGGLRLDNLSVDDLATLMESAQRELLKRAAFSDPRNNSNNSYNNVSVSRQQQQQQPAYNLHASLAAQQGRGSGNSNTSGKGFGTTNGISPKTGPATATTSSATAGTVHNIPPRSKTTGAATSPRAANESPNTTPSISSSPSLLKQIAVGGPATDTPPSSRDLPTEANNNGYGSKHASPKKIVAIDTQQPSAPPPNDAMVFELQLQSLHSQQLQQQGRQSPIPGRIPNNEKMMGLPSNYLSCPSPQGQQAVQQASSNGTGTHPATSVTYNGVDSSSAAAYGVYSSSNGAVPAQRGSSPWLQFSTSPPSSSGIAAMSFSGASSSSSAAILGSPASSSAGAAAGVSSSSAAGLGAAPPKIMMTTSGSSSSISKRGQSPAAISASASTSSSMRILRLTAKKALAAEGGATGSVYSTAGGFASPGSSGDNLVGLAADGSSDRDSCSNSASGGGVHVGYYYHQAAGQGGYSVGGGSVGLVLSPQTAFDDLSVTSSMTSGSSSSERFRSRHRYLRSTTSSAAKKSAVATLSEHCS